MSPSDDPTDPNALPSVELKFSPGPGDHDLHLPQPELGLSHHDDALGSITAAAAAAAHTMADAANFGDFPFSYPNPLGDEPLGNLSRTAFDEHPPDLFATPQPQAMSPIQDRPQDSGNSIIVQTSAFVAPAADTQGQSRPTPDASEHDTPDSNVNGVNLLEEPLSDEFGLATTAPAEGTEMGGAKPKPDKPDSVPAWSELKTKAGKERKRLPLACIACRRKKIRCSGEKPACKHCLRSRIPCVYKVTARKAAPRTDYMAMLDKRLKRMEERIIKIIPKPEQEVALANVTRAVVKPAIPGTLPGNGKPANKKRGADEAFGPDLDHWARAPSRSKLDGPNKPSTILIQEAEENKLLLEGGDALPSKEIQEHLAEVFFENIYGQAYHLLHKPSFMRKLKAGTLPPVLILSVCAIAARFSNHPKLNTYPNFLRGEEWAAAARDILMRRYDWPNITILTCLLILGLHEFGTCHGGRSWALGGQAIRMAFALQLHKDLEHDPMRGSGKSQFSFIDREIRRRTMWACFLMDRFNSSGTDRPYFIREETLKIPLPIKEKNFQYDMPGPTETLNGQVLEPLSEDNPNEARENMGVAAWMIKAIALWGRIIAYLNQGGKELDPHPMWSPESEYAKLLKQTEEFQNELPDCLKYTPENLKMHESENMANQFLFLHISIQQNILFMNRFAVSSPGGHSLQDVPKTFVTKAGAKAFAAANRISELLKDAESHFITAPFTGYCAFLSSTVHIFGIFSGNPSMEATSKRNLATNVRFLSKMKRYWGMFHWMSENLREQYRTCADAARQGNKASENASSSPIFQYGDWFDRYPHGVSQSDFLDPAAYKKKEKGDDAVLEQKPELHTVEEFFTNLSPKTAEAAVANGIRPGQPNAPQLNKRKQSITRKPSIASSRGPDQPVGVDPLQADFSRHHSLATAEQLHAAAAAARLHQRSYSVSAASAAGGPPPLQTTGPPGPGFSPLAVGPANPASYPTSALSPVSPVAFSHPHPPAAAAPPFHHPHHHHHHHHPAPAAFFPNDPFAIPLAATPPHGMTRLDRQLVFGAYGAAHHHHGSAADPAGLRWDGETGPNGASAGAANGSRDTRHAHHHSLHGGHDPAAAALHAANLFPAAEPSSAWFMPFNMEPPEIGPDGGLGAGAGAGLDAFGGVFGAGAIH